MSFGNFVAVVAAGVAVGTVVVSWIQMNSTLRQNRELADLGAVRSVLDEAVVGLLAASMQIAKIQDLKETPHGLKPPWEAADLAGKRLAAELERLKVRFGIGHPIVESFEGTVAACAEVTRAADKMIERKPSGVELRNKDERAAQDAELDAWRKQGRDIIEDESERFEIERKHFLGAAYALTGAKLKGSDAPS